MHPLVAAGLAAAIALGAWRAGTLDAGGALAAWSVGLLVLTAAGWTGGAALLCFFVGASAVSRLPPALPTPLDPKGHRRDAWQVYANGGPAALACLLALLGILSPTAGLWALTASLAAAAADTWATSVGALSRSGPRHILSGARVPPGTSGGVTWIGTAGAAAGALLVSLVPGLTGHSRLWPVATIGGRGGRLLASVLGATVQARFRCPRCAAPSEWPRHRCGTRTRHEGGWRWLTNDGVNAMATGTAALLGWAGWRWLSSS